MIAVGEEIPGINLQALTGVSSSPFQWKLLSLFVLTALFIALALMVPSIPWILPSVALGLMYAHAVELQHQCLHNTALRDTSWNRRIGILLGLPLLVSFSDYQNSHMRHHKLLGTPEDREFFNYGYESLTTLRALIPHLLMIRHYRDVAVFMAKAGVGKITRPDATLRMALRIRSEYRIMAIFLIVMLVITIVFQTTIFLKIWLIPLLVGIPAHALIARAYRMQYSDAECSIKHSDDKGE
jgi:fatty acid desaturase